VTALFFSRDQPPAHTDRFLMPAISRVDYRFGPERHFIITSQCTPVARHDTMVYTVITFRFSRIAPLVRLVFEPLGRGIIRHDVAVLARQTRQLRRFGGPRFTSVETDLVGPHIRALWRRAAGAAPAPGLEPRCAHPEVDRRVAIRF